MNSFYVEHTKFVIEDYSKNNYNIKSYDKIYNADINEFTLNELIIQNYINGDYVIIDDYFKYNNITVDNKYCIYIEAKESRKNINTVLEIIDYLYNNNFNNQSVKLFVDDIKNLDNMVNTIENNYFTT